MHDPVIAADGHTYERSAIQQWLQNHTFSPITGIQLSHTKLMPNFALQLLIIDQTLGDNK